MQKHGVRPMLQHPADPIVGVIIAKPLKKNPPGTAPTQKRRKTSSRRGTAPGTRPRTVASVISPPKSAEGFSVDNDDDALEQGEPQTHSHLQLASNRVHHHLSELSAAISEVISEDAEWLDEEYGFSVHLEALFGETEALLSACVKEHQRNCDLISAKTSSEKRAESQRSVLAAIEFENWGNVLRLQEDVQALERQILEMDPQRELEVPRSLLKVNQMQRFIWLRFTRQDELLMLMKKRLAALDRDRPLTETLDRFGSVQALLNAFERAEDTNAKLSLREKRFAHEPLLKRRHLRECTPEYLRVLVIALQNELSSCRTVLQQLALPKHPLSDVIHHREFAPPDRQHALDVDKLYDRILAQGEGNEPDNMKSSSTRSTTTTTTTTSTSADDCERQRQSNGRSISLAKKQLRKSLERVGRVLGVGKFAGSGRESNVDDEKNVDDAFEKLQNLPRVMEQCEKTMSDQQELVHALAEELSRERQLNFKQSSVLHHVLASRPDVGQHLVPFNVENAVNKPDRYHREHTEEEMMNGHLIEVRHEDNVMKVVEEDAKPTEVVDADTTAIVEGQLNIDEAANSLVVQSQRDLTLDPTFSGKHFLQQDTIQLLKLYSAFIKQMFSMFSASEDDRIYLDQLIGLCKHFQLVPNKIPKRTLLSIVNLVQDEFGQGHANEDAFSFSRDEFAEALCRISLVVYGAAMYDEYYPTQCSRVELFLDYLQTTNEERRYREVTNTIPKPFQDKLSTGEAPDELSEHRALSEDIVSLPLLSILDGVDAQIRQIFSFYSRSQVLAVAQTLMDDEILCHPGSKTLNLAEFSLFCKQFGIVPMLISVRDAVKVFRASNHGPGAGEKRDERVHELSFPEFKDSIARLALMVGDDDDVEVGALVHMLDYLDISNLHELEMREKMRTFATTTSITTTSSSTPAPLNSARTLSATASRRRTRNAAKMKQTADEIPKVDIDFDTLELLEERGALSNLQRIFIFYCGCIETPSQQQQRQHQLRLGELNIFCRDFAIVPTLLKREQAQVLFSHCVEDSTSLSFPKFVEWLVRASVEVKDKLDDGNATFTSLLDSTSEFLKHLEIDSAPFSSIRRKLKGGASLATALPALHHRKQHRRRLTSTSIHPGVNVSQPVQENLLRTLRSHDDMLKDIFRMYARSQASTAGEDFNENAEESKRIDLAELVKLLEDFAVVPRLLSKRESEKVFKFTMSRGKEKTWNFSEFQKCIVHCAMVAFSKPEFAAEFSSAPERLNALLEQLQLNSQIREYRSRMKSLSERKLSKISNVAQQERWERLYNPEVQLLLNQQRKLLQHIFEIYRCSGPKELMSLSGFLLMARDYKIVPNLLSLAELKKMLRDSEFSSSSSDDDRKSEFRYDEFVTALLLCAGESWEPTAAATPHSRARNILQLLAQREKRFRAKSEARRV